MNQTSGDQELSDYDVKARQKKVLYFSSGEILTESEEEEDEDELYQTFWVSQVRSHDGCLSSDITVVSLLEFLYNGYDTF